jgi:hypothetical protein
MLAGAYRLSKRQIHQMVSGLFGLSISTGMVCKLERQSAEALETPYNELAVSVHQADVVNLEVVPTNNVAERAMRRAVIWRKISGETDSTTGSRFVERMLTVVASCRQQGRSVLNYLTSCFEAVRCDQAAPSLLPVMKANAKVA